jgi:hypothetical protein
VTSLEQALAKLPGTAEGIAAYLIEQDCRGRRKDSLCCPVANYLDGIGEFHRPEVTENSISYEVGEDDQQMVLTPDHMTEFITRFDKGEWPELDIDRREFSS